MAVGPNEIIRVSARMRHSVFGDHVNVFHWKTSGSFLENDGDVVTAIDGKLDAIYSALTSFIATDTDPYDYKVDIVEHDNGKESAVRVLGTYTWTLTSPPGGTGDSLPSTVSSIVNFRTTIPKVFGRKYWGHLIENTGSGGILTGAVVTALGNAAAALLADITMTTGTLEPVVFSIKAGSPYGYAATLIAAVVNGITGSQRRRRINRGS